MNPKADHLASAMIFAAGRGERLKPYTNFVAKPALPFLGQPMISYAHHWLKLTGVKQAVVNVHHRPETVLQVLPLLGPAPELKVSEEKDQLLGSGGGLKFAQEQGLFGQASEGGSPPTQQIWLFNGDSVVLSPSAEKNLAEIWKQQLEQEALATLLVTPHPRAGLDFGGVWLDSSNQVQHFGLKPQTGPGPLKAYHYSGIMLVSSEVFSLPLGENIIYDGLLPAIQSQGAKVLAHVEPQLLCLETGNLKDYCQSHKTALEILNQPTHPLWPQLRALVSGPNQEGQSSSWPDPQQALEKAIEGLSA